MRTLYQVRGSLDRGFTGQITYTVCLPHPVSALDICFSFEKQHFASPSEVPYEELADYCLKHYGQTGTKEELLPLFFQDTKTEMHLLATINDEFAGCIHKQLTCRHMYLSPSNSSEGCICPPVIEGVLKVTILVFQVLLDHTPYSLTVSAEDGAEN